MQGGASTGTRGAATPIASIPTGARQLLTRLKSTARRRARRMSCAQTCRSRATPQARRLYSAECTSLCTFSPKPAEGRLRRFSSASQAKLSSAVPVRPGEPETEQYVTHASYRRRLPPPRAVRGLLIARTRRAPATAPLSPRDAPARLASCACRLFVRSPHSPAALHPHLTSSLGLPPSAQGSSASTRPRRPPAPLTFPPTAPQRSPPRLTDSSASRTSATALRGWCRQAAAPSAWARRASP